ncbi:hypothetical protein WICPIJ_006346 [Wickerhamomyces pijperi]|uniref:BTB domain-containing protein n=1 Tax=Wickerhamomyces pijperi TaxID=599730 RepID=A0A9P8TKA6_WICPI|nr:hypothetical protein WICPIJ_006346 [Wickerhamomyces pijperi]
MLPPTPKQSDSSQPHQPESTTIDPQLIEDLCASCRTGDIATVDKLLSLGAPVNHVDSFDNTPLYLASLCGHEDLVMMLLQRGAVCDSDKYEGVRCIYGALTDRIRKMLLSYDMSKAVDANLPFAIHFRGLVTELNGVTQDFAIRVGQQGDKLVSDQQQNSIVRCHRFILSARCPVFLEKLLDDWKDLSYIDLSQTYKDELALRCILDHIYLIHDPTKFAKVNKHTLLEYTQLFELKEYTTQLQYYLTLTNAKDKAKFNNELQVAIYNDSRIDLKGLVMQNVIGNKLVVHYDDEVSEASYSEDEEEESEPELSEYQLSRLRLSDSTYPDLIISVSDASKNQMVYYPVHRSVLIRLDYFKVMFDSSFTESQYFEIDPHFNILSREQSPRIVNLPVESTKVAEIILKYIYFDHTDIPLDHSVEVLKAADLLLNDRLKTMAAITITKSEDLLPSGFDIYDILRTAWDCRVERLEHHVAKIIAEDLERFSRDPKFLQIVKESSERIKARQETDTIELIDDIRYYLAKKWAIDHDGLFDGQTESEEFLRLLPDYNSYLEEMDKVEALLEGLNLDA